MTHIECGKSVTDGSAGNKADRVFPQAEVQVEVGVDTELPDRFIKDSHFTHGAVVERFSLAFGQFTSDKDFMLAVFIHAYRVPVHKPVIA